MKIDLRVGVKVFLLVILFSVPFCEVAQTQAEPTAIESRSAQVEGTKLHYLTAGHGPTGKTVEERILRLAQPIL
jgi:hypothetical protein